MSIFIMFDISNLQNPYIYIYNLSVWLAALVSSKLTAHHQYTHSWVGLHLAAQMSTTTNVCNCKLVTPSEFMLMRWCVFWIAAGKVVDPVYLLRSEIYVYNDFQIAVSYPRNAYSPMGSKTWSVECADIDANNARSLAECGRYIGRRICAPVLPFVLWFFFLTASIHTFKIENCTFRVYCFFYLNH